MRYFENVLTIEDAKKLYRNLAKEHHPDKGGDAEIMKVINNEYDFICSKLLKGENLNTEQFNEQWTASQLFKDQINSIINLPGLVIEIVGLWIWVTGDTRMHKDILKGAGYWFASKKVAWYWRPEHLAGGRGKYSLDELRTKYGSQAVNTSNFKQFNRIAS